MVLCSFWQSTKTRQDPGGEGRRDGHGAARGTNGSGEEEGKEREKQSVMTSLAVDPVPVPVLLSGGLASDAAVPGPDALAAAAEKAALSEGQRAVRCDVVVPREAAWLLQRQGFVTLDLSALLGGSSAASHGDGSSCGGRCGEGLLGCLLEESVCISDSMDWIGNEGFVDLVSRCPQHVGGGECEQGDKDAEAREDITSANRTCPLAFRRMRQSLARLARGARGARGAVVETAQRSTNGALGGDCDGERVSSDGAGEGFLGGVTRQGPGGVKMGGQGTERAGAGGAGAEAEAGEAGADAAVNKLLLETLPSILREILPHRVHAGTGDEASGGVCGQREHNGTEQRGDLFLYNENFVELTLGAGGDGGIGVGTWKEEEEEVVLMLPFPAPAHIEGQTPLQNTVAQGRPVGPTACPPPREPLFYSVWLALDAQHVFNIIPHEQPQHARQDVQAVAVRVGPGEALIMSSRTRYCHSSAAAKRAGGGGIDHTSETSHNRTVRLWNTQYSTSPLLVSGGRPVAQEGGRGGGGGWSGVPIAFAVPCAGVGGVMRSRDGLSGGEGVLGEVGRRDNILSSCNGVRIFSGAEEEDCDKGEFGEGEEGGEVGGGGGGKGFLALRRAGDCALVTGGTWHKSVSCEKNVMLLKLVVFCRSVDGRVRGGEKGGEGAGVSFRLGEEYADLVADCFSEVMSRWDEFACLPPRSSQIWTPYNDYQLNHMQHQVPPFV